MPRHDRTSNAGPFEVSNESTLSPGDRETVDLRQYRSGPRNERGHLRKWFGARDGFDQAMVINTSDQVMKAEFTGDFEITVPPATTTSVTGNTPEGSRGDESQAYNRVTFVNPSFNTEDIDAGELVVAFKNGVRPEETQPRARLSIADAIPGLSTNG